jgi:hypothetical protein
MGRREGRTLRATLPQGGADNQPPPEPLPAAIEVIAVVPPWGRVLYVAADGPKQIARSWRRMFTTPKERGHLRARRQPVGRLRIAAEWCRETIDRADGRMLAASNRGELSGL